MKNNKATGSDSEDDSDACDIVEANCELAVVEGQICSIPYELYDLPDLKGILSIETWNLYLTDEERFFLSSFLPDMDQNTFNLTMEKLLGGSDLYIGNPVHRFYQKLRGGLYVPKVACCRECLMFIKRKKYYYSLRSYHENMILAFTNMTRLWDQSRKEAGVNERLFLWSERTQRQSLKLPDLNRVPSDIDRLDHEIFPLCSGSKGIIKAKITKSRIFQNYSRNLVSGEPRGFLNTLPPPRANGSGISQDKTSPLYQASVYSGTIFQKLGGGRVNTAAELPKCVLNQQDTLSIYSETTQRPIRKVKKKGADPSSDDSASNARQQDVPRESSVSKYFMGQNLSTSQEEYACFCPILSNSKARILGTGTRKTETAKDSSLRPKNLGECNEPLDIEGDHMFSYSTSKRRKVQRIHVA
ncbi:PREDICTED: uncharacterized protein LOC104801336 [Tarenaya hassleriana]|uniref:uncharacterized protein LOC104801336 n=1 Tax=Tarenaya hassleriana TaxID=28532 RepID=UPI00053C4FA0|nr:PREDICTED: uncharacterized protein LOC104801336 [Tarenaya hassleriana]